MDEDEAAYDATIRFRCTGELRKSLEALAKNDKRKFSDYLRLALADYVKQQTAAARVVPRLRIRGAKKPNENQKN